MLKHTEVILGFLLLFCGSSDRMIGVSAAITGTAVECAIEKAEKWGWNRWEI